MNTFIKIIPKRATGKLFAALTFLFAFLVFSDAVSANTGSSSPAGNDLNFFSAIILGLVEGVTEYLPVSSTGHLLLTNKILGLGGTEQADKALETYAIAIQIGAILAVCVLYQNRIKQMIDGLLGKSEEGRTVFFAVVFAFIPTAILGLLLKDPVRKHLFGAPPIAAAWIVGGIAILVLSKSGIMERTGKKLAEISPKQAVLIGVAQAIALWPGTSRSLITIIAALLVGLSLKAAVEFSFLLGLVTLSAATVLATAEGGSDLVEVYGYINPLVGLVVAFIAALASIKWMVSWLQERSLNVFGFYRIAIGAVTFTAIATNTL